MSLQVGGITEDGGMWHTIRTPDKHWTQFGNVVQQAGDVGTFVSVGAAGFYTGELNVVGVSEDGGMWHTIRTPDKHWTQFGNVVQQAGDVGTFVSVGAAFFS